MNVAEFQQELSKYSDFFLKGLKYKRTHLFIQTMGNGHLELKVLYQGFNDKSSDEAVNVWFEDSSPSRLISQIQVAISPDVPDSFELL